MRSQQAGPRFTCSYTSHESWNTYYIPDHFVISQEPLFRVDCHYFFQFRFFAWHLTLKDFLELQMFILKDESIGNASSISERAVTSICWEVWQKIIYWTWMLRVWKPSAFISHGLFTLCTYTCYSGCMHQKGVTLHHKNLYYLSH